MFVTPMSTLEFLYLCMVEFANFRDPLRFLKPAFTLNLCMLVQQTLALELLYLCVLDFASFKNTA